MKLLTESNGVLIPDINTKTQIDLINLHVASSIPTWHAL